MKMLFKKMLRDFKDHKIQFLSIFLMALIGVYGFTGISGEVVGLVDVSTHYYEDTNLADGWIYGEDLDNETFSCLFLIEADGAEALYLVCLVQFSGFTSEPFLK